MQDILMRAGCFIGIIILGYTLRSIGVFKEACTCLADESKSWEREAGVCDAEFLWL